MKVLSLGCLLTNSLRSKAYAQKLVKHGLLPEVAIYLEITPNAKKQIEAESSLARLIESAYFERRYFLYKDSPQSICPPRNEKPVLYQSFNPEENVLDTLESAKIPVRSLRVSSINDNKVIEALGGLSQKFFVFSGGGILRKPILSLGKRFIHIHPGRIPQVRGSMAVEWSTLIKEPCAASAIFMSSKIDCGDILLVREFQAPKLEYNNLPMLYSPHIRSEVLIELIARYVETGEFQGLAQNPTSGNTYYKMHPILNNVVFQRLLGGDA